MRTLAADSEKPADVTGAEPVFREYPIVQTAGFSPAAGPAGVFFAIGGTDASGSAGKGEQIHYLKLE
jgi:hypothetical protein